MITQNPALKKICDELAFNANKLPILQDTFSTITELYEKNGYEQEFFELESIVLSDPFLTLKVLFKIANQKNRLQKDVDSIKKVLMLLGVEDLFELVLKSTVSVQHEGLSVAIKRARQSSLFAKNISIIRYDILPEEVALATLMADLGELMLWVFKPEIPEKIRNEMIKGSFKRNQEAQLMLCGFKFKELSLCLAQKWNLPTPIIDLMSNGVNLRARVAKTSVDISRHLNEHNGYLAIPDDIKEYRRILYLNEKENNKILSLLNLEDFVTKETYEFILKKI